MPYTPDSGTEGGDIMRPIHYLFYILYLFLITFLIFFDQRKPMKRFGWILTLIFLPGLGLLLYWFVGSDSLWAHQKRKKINRHQDIFHQMAQIIAATGRKFDLPSSKNMLFHQRYGGSILTADNEIEVYTSGAAKFKHLFHDLEQARDSIHIVYFTIHNDRLGQKLIDTLIKKVQQGVEVKLLYDGFGCLTTSIHGAAKKLRRAGGDTHCIRPYTRTINYRNHRKLVIIDGKIGYFGGINIGDHYQDGLKGKQWRDTHVRVSGSMVHELQQVFLSDWIFSLRASDIGLRQPLQHYFPAPTASGNLKAQVVASGLYNSNHNEIMNLSYFNLISQAQKRVWIQTPYFRPSDTIINALKLVAALGVDVRLMVSLAFAWGNVFNRSLNRYFLRQLVGSEVKVFGYTDILHSKTMIIDDHGLAVGSVNLNTRSLQIDDEIYGYFESKSLVQQHEEIFTADLTHCIEVDRYKFQDQDLLSRAIESVLSFLTPLS